MSSMTKEEQEEKEEILHFMRVLNAFKAYRLLNTVQYSILFMYFLGVSIL